MPHLPCIELTAGEQRELLQIARQSIETGLLSRQPLTIDLTELPPALHSRHGVFVTLSLQGALRGCIGSMEPDLPLPQAVADAAHGAAFRDPRFRPLAAPELAGLEIEISILSSLVDMHPVSREDLLSSLRAGTDGLLITDGPHRATFLPKVWEQLPRPEQFLAQLFGKAGLGADHWSAGLRVQRYTTLTFSE